MNPKFPIYIISKGRWKTRYTSIALESIGVDYRIVIEPHEFAQYASVIDPQKILVLPFSNLVRRHTCEKLGLGTFDKRRPRSTLDYG